MMSLIVTTAFICLRRSSLDVISSLWRFCRTIRGTPDLWKPTRNMSSNGPFSKKLFWKNSDYLKSIFPSRVFFFLSVLSLKVTFLKNTYSSLPSVNSNYKHHIKNSNKTTYVLYVRHCLVSSHSHFIPIGISLS